MIQEGQVYKRHDGAEIVVHFVKNGEVYYAAKLHRQDAPSLLRKKVDDFERQLSEHGM